MKVIPVQRKGVIAFPGDLFPVGHIAFSHESSISDGESEAALTFNVSVEGETVEFSLYVSEVRTLILALRAELKSQIDHEIACVRAERGMDAVDFTP